MQSPIIVFDHINKTVVSVPTGPASGDQQLDRILAAAQSSQASTSNSAAPKH